MMFSAMVVARSCIHSIHIIGDWLLCDMWAQGGMQPGGVASERKAVEPQSHQIRLG